VEFLVMDTYTWVAIALGLAVCIGAGFWVGRWSLRPREAALASRVTHLEKARQVALEHGQQARRQIEILQKEIAMHQKARADALAARRRSRDLNDELDAAERTVVLPGRSPDSFNLSRLPSHGFADTQPI
jgi:hypothetical protein